MNENEIKEGDWFKLDGAACSTLSLTSGKAYQCVKIEGIENISPIKIYFVDDKGDVDYHHRNQFTKVSKPEESLVGKYLCKNGKDAWHMHSTDDTYVHMTSLKNSDNDRWREEHIHAALRAGTWKLIPKPEEDPVPAIPEPDIDWGADLVGKHISMGEDKLTYLIKEYNPKTGNLKFRSDEYKVSNFYTPKVARSQIGSNFWKIVDPNDDFIGKIFVTKSGQCERIIVSLDEINSEYKMVATAGGGNCNTINRTKEKLAKNFIEVTGKPEKPPTDTGTDLIGKFLTRGSSDTVYTLVSKHTKNKKPSIKLTWSTGNEAFYDVINIRYWLENGDWKIVEPKPMLKEGDKVIRISGKPNLAAKLNTTYTASNIKRADGLLGVKEVGGAYKKSDWVLESDYIAEGYDLIGREFTRGGACVYIFKCFIPTAGRMKITWKNGTDTQYTVGQCRSYLSKIGGWKFVVRRISKNADDLIGKTFKRIDSADEVLIRDSSKYDYDIGMHYGDNNSRNWNVSIDSFRNWIKEGKYVLVDKTTGKPPEKPDDFIGKVFLSGSGHVERTVVSRMNNGDYQLANDDSTQTIYRNKSEILKRFTEVAKTTDKKFPEVSDDGITSADTIAQSIYDDFSNGGWDEGNFEDLHDKTIKEWLKRGELSGHKNLTQWKTTSIRQLVQDISKKESKKFVRQPWLNSMKVRDHLRELGYKSNYYNQNEKYIWTYENGKFTTTNTKPDDSHTVKKLPEESLPERWLSAEQLLQILIKDQHGCTRSFQPGYNSEVLRVVNISVATDVIIDPLNVINALIREGKWTVIKGESLTVDCELIAKNTITAESVAVQPVFGDIDAIFDDKIAIDSTIPVGTLMHRVNGKFVPKDLEKNPQYQHYCAMTETYSTDPEEEIIMQKTTNDIVIAVPMAAYSETITISMYGEKVDVTDEASLLSVIAQIETDQTKLKDINKTAKSKRITGQIAKLGAARTKIVTLLDALPEEGESES